RTLAVGLKAFGRWKAENGARIAGVVESQPFVTRDQLERADPLTEELATWFEPPVLAFTGQRPRARDVPASGADARYVFAIETHAEGLIGVPDVFAGNRRRSIRPRQIGRKSLAGAVDVRAIEEDAVADHRPAAQAKVVVDVTARDGEANRERRSGL